jgi:magnesium transporter
MDNRQVIRSVRWQDDDKTAAVTTGVVAQPPDSGWIWIDLSGEDPEIVHRQATDFGIDHSIVLAALEPGTRLPDLEEHPHYLHAVLNGFLTGSGERLAVTSVDIVIGENFILSVHNADVAVIDLAFERLAEGALLPQPSPIGLLGYLAMLSNRRFGQLLSSLEDQIDALEELALAADPRAITEAHALRRDIILIRRALRPQRQVYEELYLSEHPLIAERDRGLFQRADSAQANSLEALDAAMQLLGSMLETHRSATADQTNEIVRVLTVFSAVMLPLGLIAGIWGMNFHRIPAAAQDWGFWVVLGLMAGIAGALWIYFGRRGFVGAPRLREVPKSVGLGLIQVGTAPIRVVSGGIETTRRLIGRPEEGSDQTPLPTDGDGPRGNSS